MLARDELSAERRGGRAEEGATEAGERLRGVERQHRARRPDREDEEPRAARGDDDERRGGQGAPVQPVRRPAADERQREERRGLGEPDEAERERVAGEGVHLPAEDGALDLRGDLHRADRDEKGAVLAEAQGGVAVVGQPHPAAPALAFSGHELADV